MALDKLTTMQRIMLENQKLPNDTHELEQMLSEEGFDISNPLFARQVATREKQLAEKLDQRRRTTRNRNENYEKVRNYFLSWRDYSAFLFNLFFVIIGIPLGIALLVASEVVSVTLGLRTFFNEELAVLLLASTLVLMYFAVEWRHAQLVAKYGRPPVYRFTLASVVRRMRYFFSLNPNMLLEPVNDSADIKSVNTTRNTLVVIIVILGILGRLDNLLSAPNAANVAWYEQILAIFKSSSLKEFLEYLGGGFIALALLVATHYLVSYIYEIFRSAVGGADEVDFFDPSWEAEERDKMMVALYQTHLRQIWQKKEAEVRMLTSQIIPQLPTNT
jgi:hypothetical protein